MLTRTDPAAVRWLVGTELMRLRQSAGLSVSHVAQQCGVSKTKISQIELGTGRQHQDDITKILKALRADNENDRIGRLLALADSRTWWAPWTQVIPKWHQTVVGLEGIASKVFLYEPAIMPGLLQTREYALALTKASGFIRPDHVEPIAQLRQARAERLTAEPTLNLHVVMEESAFLRAVGSPETMRAQLDHVLTMAKRPNITVQLIRPQDGPHGAVTAGQFEIVEFTDAGPVGYVEGFDRAIYLREISEVRTYTMFAENVAATALSPEASAEHIRALL